MLKVSFTLLILIVFGINISCTLQYSISDLNNNSSNSGDLTNLNPSPIENEIAEVTNLNISQILSDSAIISFDADLLANKVIIYSTTGIPTEKCNSGVSVDLLSLNKTQLTGLSSETTYYFRVCVLKGTKKSTGVTGQFKTLKSLSIAPLYASLQNWNDYVENNGSNILTSTGAACTWPYAKKQAACIHGAEIFKVNLPLGVLCADVKAYDISNVFIWKCDSSSSPNFVYSTGIKPNKGLRDLVTKTGFKKMSLVVKVLNVDIYSTPLETWWQNPVEELPISNLGGVLNLTNGGSASGKIFVLDTNRTSDSFAITENKISVVTINGATLIQNVLAQPLITMNTGIAQTWIEGDYQSNANTISGINNLGIMVRNLKGISNTGNGVAFSNSYFVSVLDSKIFAKNSSVSFSTSGAYILGRSQLGHLSTSGLSSVTNLNNSESGVVNQVTLANTYNYGIGYPSVDTVISNITGANINSQFIHSFQGNTPIYMLVNNALGINAGDINHWRGGGNTYSQLLMGGTSGNLITVYGINAAAVKFTNNMVLSSASCFSDVNTFSSGITNGTCALIAPSDANQVIGFDMTKVFKGAITESDTKNNSDELGSALFSLSLDFLNFDNVFRLWGRPEAGFPSSANKGPCIGTDVNCRIWDFRLKNDTLNMAFNRTETVTTQNASFVSGLNCPSSISGNKITTHYNGTVTYTFLTNAMEIIGDGIGNENSLCESNEECIYTPNFGSYQGEGDYYENECLFVNGTVSNVKMFAFPTNGVL